MKRQLRVALMVLSLLLMAGPHAPLGTELLVNKVHAQTAPCGGVYPAVGDASVYQGSPDLAFGGARQLHVARDRGGEWRTLLHFDLRDRIPHGASIQKAELQMVLAGAPQPLPYSLAIRSAQGTWSEAEVTWSTQPTMTGRYDDRSSLVAAGNLHLDVTALVTSWSNGDVRQTSLMLLPALDEMDVVFHSQEARGGPPLVQLLILCAMEVEEQSPDQHEADQRQMVDLTRIRQQSAQPLQLQLARGVPRFAMFDLPVPSDVAADGLSRAQWFLNEYRGLLRLTEPTTQLQLIRRSGDDQHLFFRQRHQGIPVWPAELGVHLAGGRVIAVNGNYLPEITLSPLPQLSALQAEAVALALGNPDTPDTKVTGVTQLRYVNLGLLGAPDQRTYLAWQVNLGQTVTQESLLIDANSGALLHRNEYVESGFDLDLESAHNTGSSTSCWAFTTDDEQWFDEDGVYGDASPDAEGFQSYENIKDVYYYWKNTFGRDSYDDDGEDIALYIHVNPHKGAHYDGFCDIFEFGNGNAVLDIMGHEFTHAVDDSEGELPYFYQPGALDESFADIFGHAVDPGDWTIGEDSLGNIDTRDMQNPVIDKFSKFQFLAPNDDHGGVHTNSGIHNKAAFLLTDGGTFNGRTVKGIGQSKAEELFYHTLVGWLGSNSQFIDARNGMVHYAFFYYGPLSNELCQVRNAYAAVEIGEGDADCDGAEDNQEPDNDNDGVADGSDNCPNVANPGQGNSDGNGQGDACDNNIDDDAYTNDKDNCDYTYSIGQADFDDDGVGDACDDSDGDGDLDDADNCRTTSNSDQKNMDSDSMGDVCDPDRDGDFKNNDEDNCPDTPNPEQIDSDGDGWGDACDLCPGVKSSDNADTDGDGLGNPCDPDDDNDTVLDEFDNCPFVKNPDQLDFNQNGVGYYCDEKEQQINTREDSYLFHSLLPLLLPVPDCIKCGDEYLLPGYEEILAVELPVGFTARVIDSTGRVVAKSNLGATQQVLSFNPKTYANQAAGEASLAAQVDGRQATATLAPDDINYWLYILPAEGVDPTRSYEVQVNISEDNGKPRVFLPLVRP